MPKYRDLIRQMFSENEKLFMEFKDLHDKYAADRKKWQNEYNQMGTQVMEIIRVFEARLCGKSERGGNGVFSPKLADKFWVEIRAFFPLIDFVGVKIK